MPAVSCVVFAITVAWFGFACVRRLLSGRFWLWLLPDLAPPLLHTVGPALLLAATPLAGAFQPWCAGMSVTALVLGVGGSGFSWRRRPDPRQPGQAAGIRVVSWNTEYWHQHNDKEDFYAFLLTLRADVYLLQEYMNCVDAVPTKVDERAELHRRFPGYEITIRGELATLSRFPVTGVAYPGPAGELGPRTPWREVYEATKVLRTDLCVDGDTLSVYNVHVPAQLMDRDRLFSARFYASLRERFRRRMTQLRALEKDIDANANPVLIAGDFNSTAAMGDIRRILRRCVSANHANDRIYPSTWPARGPALWQLDWTFTSGVLVHGYDLRDPRDLSDHRAQELLISLPPSTLEHP